MNSQLIRFQGPAKRIKINGCGLRITDVSIAGRNPVGLTPKYCRE